MTDQRQQVTVVDIKMPFGSMVVFMVKWAIASIPAFLILVALSERGHDVFRFAGRHATRNALVMGEAGDVSHRQEARLIYDAGRKGGPSHDAVPS